MIAKILEKIVAALAAKLVPVIEKAVKDKIDQLLPGVEDKLRGALSDEIEKYGKEITSKIPGSLDDSVLGSLVKFLRGS